MINQATTDSSSKFTAVTIPDDLSSQGLESSRAAILKYHHYIVSTSDSLTNYFTTKDFEELLLLAYELRIPQFDMTKNNHPFVPAIQINSISTANVNQLAFNFKHSLYDLIYKSLKDANPDEVEDRVKMFKRLIEINLQDFALLVREKREQLQRISGNEGNKN